MQQLFIGTSGYNYKDWKDLFYVDVSQKDWLTYYSLFFNTVEINATFYRSFPKTVFQKWHDATNDNFVFTIKGPRMITHYKQLVNVHEDLNLFFDNALGLSEKLQTILWQFPKQFQNTERNFEKLQTFLPLLPKDKHHAIELRDTSWFNAKTFALLDQHAVGFVINEAKNFPRLEIVTGKIAYIRLHGPGALYASSYSEDTLKSWGEKIKKFRKKVDVYCYFNNDYFGYALENIFTLQKYC